MVLLQGKNHLHPRVPEEKPENPKKRDRESKKDEESLQ